MRWLLAAALAALPLGPAQAAEVPPDVAAAVKAAMPQIAKYSSIRAGLPRLASVAAIIATMMTA